MIDFHSHILPKIDDGSKSCSESLQMLKAMENQGIETVFATPHFYAHKESPNQFLKRREASFSHLQKEIFNSETKPYINIICGAEVAYFPGIRYCEDLEKLSAVGTNLLLLEMPFTTWTSDMYTDIEMISERGIVPIIAHIERYKSFQNLHKSIYFLQEKNAIIQANSSFFLNFFTSKTALSMIEKGEINLLGSDAHNMHNRIPNLGLAIEKIKKKNLFYLIEANENKLLENNLDMAVNL